MTAPATTRRAGPFNGNGTSTSFPFTFKVFSKADVQVEKTTAAAVTTTLVQDSDYSVAVNADQDASPGGTITYPISGTPLAVGEKLVVLGATAYAQPTDLPEGGAYRAKVVEDALDRTVFQVQQLAEEIGRSLTLPATSATADTTLPSPAAGNVIGWNDTADGLRNIDPTTLASIVAYSNRRVLVANGGLSTYALAVDPGNANNCMVAVGGVVQTPGVDYTVSGTTLTPTTLWPAGTGNVAIVYGEALPVGTQDASAVTFTQTGAGAVTRTAQARLRDTVSVKDFGAVGDGVTNDRAAIQAAFNASKSVYFPAGTYWLGTYGTAENIIDLSALGDGISIRCENGVELLVQTTASVIPRVFYMRDNSYFSCDPIRLRDTGYDSSITWKGAVGFYMDCTTGASWGDVKFQAIYARNLVAGVLITGGNATNRIRGVKIGQLFADDCYYGFNAQNNGDGVAIDNLAASLNYRPYFVYGCTDHKVKIFNRNARSGSGPVNISRSPGGLNTSGIDVTYVARDMSVNITHVLINHIDLLGGEISNVRLNIDIRSSVIYTPLRFVNYTGSGGSETSGASSNLVYDVSIAGSCDAQANAITAVAAYASRKKLNFTPGTNFVCDTNITALFSVNASARTQTVSWTASVNPAIGNGVISGDYDVANGICTYSVSLTAGSTTTFGTGDWSFSAPFASTATSVGSVWVLDSGSTYYVGTCIISSGSSTIQCYTNAASGFRNTLPMTWANGDQLQLTVTYPVS